MGKIGLTPAREETQGSSREEPMTRVRELEEVFEFRSPEAIAEYLGSRSTLSQVDLLLEVSARAKSYFGPECRFVLDLRTDREGDGPPELFAYVVTGMPASEAWNAMCQMETGWWLEAARGEPVNLHVEFA